MSVVLTAFGIIGTAIGIVASIITFHDYRLARRIDTSTSWPITITRAVRYSHVINSLCALLDELRKTHHFVPDVIVGVHYGGLVYASEAARFFYKPVAIAVVKYTDDGKGNITCDTVRVEAKANQINGRRILVVDNSIRSGQTLRMTVDALRKHHAGEIRTVVVFRSGPAHSLAWQPDHILFESSKRLKQWCR